MRKILPAIASVIAVLLSLLIGVRASSAMGGMAGSPMPTGAATPTSAENSVDEVLGTYTLKANSTGVQGWGLLGELSTNQMKGNIQPPCQNCEITSMTPDLTDAGGTSVNMDTGAMLHHMVLYQQGATDTTCTGFLPTFSKKRLFAAGNERTPMPQTPGYGIYLPSGAMFATDADLMNYSSQPQTVEIRMHFTWIPGHTLKDLTAVWLDETGCGFSYFDVAAGQSHQTYTWTSTLSGNLIGLGGHEHENGVDITATDATTKTLLCDSRESQMMMSDGTVMVTGMSTCRGAAPSYTLTKIRKGDKIRLDSCYNTPAAQQGVMGIMVMFVAQT